ncbi:hypothetical protein K505DRAFT_230533 [Melanomma pulvis-pyrius CBS 109.77]|uniref:Uncharacterized protein n=1 Tax=Melanomma pulvis-pyrius CBS 109.77 TaxID=1314802 RepID=A0A6A6XTX3_9PLEO|nr:hypothetical protein K505DRAFT_230533 [Melanomma pulvis-pyrius CBS 109.77]
MSNRTHFPGITEPESTENLTEEEIRAAIAEEERIARLPTFIQDDCGDGDEFPDVPFADHVAAREPKPHRSFRAEPPSYMQMGLQKLDIGKWLTVDNTYREFHEARLELLETKKNEVLQVSAEGEAACEELMWEVVNFLTETHPALYEILESGRGRRIWNKFVNEEYALERPWDIHPLEVCARLAMEDFNVLAKSEFSGQHHLVASATLFPAGWHMPDRIGKSLTHLHSPVPLWESKLAMSVEHYFTRLSFKSAMQRTSFFIQITPHPAYPLASLLFIQEGKDFFPGRSLNIDPASILIRHERHTFRRLPKSDAVVFGVHTRLQRLVDVLEHERENLVKEIRMWPEDIARYKGRDLWEKVVVGWCLGVDLEGRDDRSVGSRGSEDE